MTTKKDEEKTSDDFVQHDVQGWVPDVTEQKDLDDFSGKVKNTVKPVFSEAELNAKLGSVDPKTPETPLYPLTGVDVVEKDATVSGYVQQPSDNLRERPYLVHADSVLAQPPYNVSPGFIQGRSTNPGLTDEMRRELGLD